MYCVFILIGLWGNQITVLHYILHCLLVLRIYIGYVIILRLSGAGMTKVLLAFDVNT